MRRLDASRLARSALLLGSGVLIAKLLLTGQIHYYLSSSFDGLTALAGVVLALLGGLELWHARRPMAEVSDHAELDAFLTLGLAALPLVAGLLLTPHALGASALGGTPVSQLVLAFDAGPPAATAAAPLPGQPAATAAVPVPGQPIADVDDLMRYLRRVGEGGVGQRVHARGLVARSAELGPNEFVLLRYAIVHCVADAQPLGLLIVAPGELNFESDHWVEVDGTLASEPRGGERLVGITAARITPSDEPPDPYIQAF